MLETLILSYIVGVLGGNSFPHFVKGITKEEYPTVFGNSPVINFFLGWLGFIVTFLLFFNAGIGSDVLMQFIFIALGVFTLGLFHSWHGAFGKTS